MKKSGIIFVLAILIVILELLALVDALGISPGRTTINYEKGLRREVQLSVVNSEYKSMKVDLAVEGELKDYITLSEKSMELGSIDYSKAINYKVELPESIEKEPGLHTAEIVALEVPKEGGEGTHVGATVAVVSQLYVYVPCPGKCIDADLNVLEKDGTANFVVVVINRGKQKIDEAKAVIEVYPNSGKKVASIETNANSIEPEARIELSKDSGIDEGKYIGKVKVMYDGQEKIFEKEFVIGEQMLGIERVWVSDFRLGGIAKFRILVENKWNDELKNVFANLIVYDDKRYEMANVKSASENIPIAAEKELTAYWDTVGVEEGEYEGKLMVKYEKGSNGKELILRLSENSLDVLGAGQVISPESTKGVRISTILVVLVIVLLIGNLAWFILFKRLMKKKKEKKVNSGVIKV